MPELWETPAGQACIEKWIAEAMHKRNSYAGSANFNSGKLWGLNQ